MYMVEIGSVSAVLVDVYCWEIIADAPTDCVNSKHYADMKDIRYFILCLLQTCELMKRCMDMQYVACICGS